MSTPLKNATYRQLQAFHALARLGSVSRAAEEMNLTQPAVSLQLAALEDSAGTPLFTRGSGGVRLTEAGELVAGYAARMVELWREAGEALAMQRGDMAGLLRVGAVTTAEYLLPPLLLEFVQQHPQVKVKLRIGNRAEIVSLLAQQEVDLAIMGRPPGELKTEAAAFARHPMAFVAAPGHRLMTGEPVELAALNGANLLVRERGSGTRSTIERLFKDAGLALDVGAEMSSNEAIKQMCAAGFGVAFLSLHACALELQTGVLAQLPVAGGPVEREWFVMRLAERKVPVAAARFRDFLRTQGQGWIDWRLEQIRRTTPVPDAVSPAPAPAGASPVGAPAAAPAAAAARPPPAGPTAPPGPRRRSRDRGSAAG